jgi:hypothetical protein
MSSLLCIVFPLDTSVVPFPENKISELKLQ